VSHPDPVPVRHGPNPPLTDDLKANDDPSLMLHLFNFFTSQVHEDWENFGKVSKYRCSLISG
jgi:hypothetical protein